jgi:hypothetical protein
LNFVQEEGMGEMEELLQGVIESFKPEEDVRGFLKNVT